MRHYLDSLRRLYAARPAWRRLYPGHGPPIDAAQHAIAEYIAHREAREAQIVQHLAPSGGALGGGVTASELVTVLYSDRHLSWELKQAATETVYNHLLFLSEKGQASPLHDAGAATHLGVRWVRA